MTQAAANPAVSKGKPLGDISKGMYAMKLVEQTILSDMSGESEIVGYSLNHLESHNTNNTFTQQGHTS